MPTRLVRTLVAVALACALTEPRGALAETPYRIFELPGAVGFGNGVNPSGVMAGSFSAADGPRAALWTRRGELVDLGKVGPGTTRATGLNARGQVVGFTTTGPGGLNALVWAGADESALLLSPAATRANAINNLGQIVGTLTEVVSGTSVVWAVYWPSAPEGAIRLAVPEGATGSAAQAINDAGQIVGSVRFGAGLSAAFWPAFDADPVLLEGLGGTFARALGINDAGEIVGEAALASAERHAAYWPGPSAHAQDLGVAGTASAALAINGAGIVAGGSGGVATVWRLRKGDTISLGALEGHTASNAVAVNARGDVIGTSGTGTDSSAVVWKRER